MKKLLVFLAVLFIAPITVNAYTINTDFDQDKCELTISGTQEGHDANVVLFVTDANPEEIKGMQTGAIENGEFSVSFILKSEQGLTIDIVVANEEGHNKTEKLSEEIPACTIVHENNNQEEQGGEQGGQGENPETHRVRFITNGGTEISDIQVDHEQPVERPEQNPEKDGFTFGGWYADQQLTEQFDFGRGIIDDTDIYARWIDNEDVHLYVMDDDEGNEISFLEENGRRFTFSIIDMLSIPKEEIIASNPEMTSELYDMVVGNIKESSEANSGKLISILQIEVIDLDVSDPDDPNYYYKTGPFNIKIKMTEAMKKYDSFKLAYINDSYTAVDFIELKVEGDYLVCTLPHLSVYSLVGYTTPESPKTYDNVTDYTKILTISLIGLSIGVFGLFKTRKRHN